jgi:NADH-quinone oxidoreductase subunit G
VDLTYDYAHLGTDRAALAGQIGMAHTTAADLDSIVIVGQGALREADGAAVLAHAMQIAAESRSGLLILHTAAARVGAMDVGAVTEGGLAAAVDGADVIWSLGADEVDIAPGPFVIYQGSHGDRGAHRADLILPCAAWTEEQGLFVNTEGRPQLAQRAGFPPGEAKENWAIIRALSAQIGAAQPWNSLAQLRQAMVAAAPHLALIDAVPENTGEALPLGTLGAAAFVTAVADHFLTNPISRASALMADLSARAKARSDSKIAAE